MSKFTEFEMVCFHNTYMSQDLVDDPHELFSYKLGIPRSEAKKMCYMIMWELPFLRKVMKSISEEEINE